MSNVNVEAYLRPPDLRHHHDNPSALTTRATKSLVTRFSITSIASSFAKRIIQTSRKPGTRRQLNSKKWNTHRGTKSEGARPKHTSPRINRDSSNQDHLQPNAGHQGILASSVHVNVGAQFEFENHERVDDITPDIDQIVPPDTNSDILEDMANNSLQPRSLVEAALRLRNPPYSMEITFAPIPACANHQGQERPNARPQQNPNPAPGPVRARGEPSPDEDLDLVRRNGGEVKIQPRAAPVGQMVTCDAPGCDQLFESAAEMVEHRDVMHSFCEYCNGRYAGQSREDHIRLRHP